MNTGGPAFPQHGWTKDPEVLERMRNQGGMTLLDWYAGQALPWCLSEFAGNAEDGTQYAEAAYEIATAMLAEKARRGGVVKESSTTDDGRLAKLEELNRELVEALEAMVCNASERLQHEKLNGDAISAASTRGTYCALRDALHTVKQTLAKAKEVA